LADISHTRYNFLNLADTMDIAEAIVGTEADIHLYKLNKADGETMNVFAKTVGQYTLFCRKAFSLRCISSDVWLQYDDPSYPVGAALSSEEHAFDSNGMSRESAELADMFREQIKNASRNDLIIESEYIGNFIQPTAPRVEYVIRVGSGGHSVGEELQARSAHLGVKIGYTVFAPRNDMIIYLHTIDEGIAGEIYGHLQDILNGRGSAIY
jgi:hypothetical protein